MNRHLIGICISSIFGLAARETLALGLELRPHAGVGYASAFRNGRGGAVFHAGGRLLLAANSMQVYGLEATYLTMRVRSGGYADHLALGIVLEQRLWDWFNMSIGTVGYIGLSAELGNPFGIVTNLGWEPNWGRVSPFVTYRSDWIFGDPVSSANSMSAGATVRF